MQKCVTFCFVSQTPIVAPAPDLALFAEPNHFSNIAGAYVLWLL